MMSLSFSEAFFSGTDDIYEVKPSDRPTSVLQEIISLPKRDRVEIARYVMKSKHPVLYTQSESFDFDVLEKVRETDSCDGYETPIRVYIDEDRDYWVDVYDIGD